ncbi:hypothetical protein [Thermostichus vulcanus]|uniref:Uncharacterized protein n=1 Tax=Thermostichus vulcanus str. 'Rupite' TaxID=2813851 RepID=A0ABT0CDT8_THEVL|nr:hypothetical protein [Thermostichus vulcanus str. 'Rupite']
MSDESRQLSKAAFNRDPHKDPLRILIATDAAREGVNLQNYCSDLFQDPSQPARTREPV